MTDRARIARAAGLVMALFVASRALGLVREMAISHRFGTGGEIDAYLAAFRLPDILFQIVAGGALASAFIPTFADYLTRDDQAGAWRLASAVINLVSIVTAALSVLAAWLAPWLVSALIAPGFDPVRQALTVELMRWMLLTPTIFGASGIVMGILNAKQHFLLPALAPVVYNVGIIAGALLLGSQMGVRGLAMGVVGGAVGHLLVQVPGLVRHGRKYTPVLGVRDPGVREVGRLMLPRMAGLAAVQLNFLVNTILASSLVPGSLAALNYAWLLMLLPQGVFAQSVATAAFPTFAAQAARHERDEMRRTLAATLRAVLYLTLPAGAGLMILSRPVVQIVFERGAFDQTSTQMVSSVLALYVLGLPAHAVVEIVVRAFYAMHDTRTPVAVGVAAMALNVLLSVALIAAFGAAGWMPHGGLALANSIATTVEMAVLLALVRRPLGGLEKRSMVAALLRTGAATLFMALIVLVLARWLSPWGPLPIVTLSMGGGAVSYALVSLVAGASEPRAVWSLLRRRET